MKKILVLLCSCMLILGSSDIVLAADNNILSENGYDYYMNSKPSETFVDFYSQFFENKENFNIYDNEENDITECFYNDAYCYYENKDFMGLKTYILNNNILGGCQKIIPSQKPKGFMSDVANKRYFYNVNKHPAAGELEYYISGTYSWNVTTGQIATTSNAAIKITRCSFGAAWSHTTDGMSANASISNDKFSVTYYGSFHLVVTLGFDIGGFPVGWTVDCGNYSGSVTGTPHA